MNYVAEDSTLWPTKLGEATKICCWGLQVPVQVVLMNASTKLNNDNQ